MKGFKEFLLRGNLLELAVAFVMGAAFGAVVESFTKVFMSVIAKIFGSQPNFDAITIAGVVVGPFITAVVNFVIIAAVIYFLIVKPMNAFNARKAAQKAPEEAAPTEVELLSDIRDLLSKQN